MESLVLAALIVAGPALYGGPIALLLSLLRRHKMSRFRRRLIFALATLAIISGAYVLAEEANNWINGQTHFGNLGMIGLLGVSTGFVAMWRARLSPAAWRGN